MTYTDESGKFYIGRKFTLPEFAQWLQAQNLGTAPYNAVGYHHTYRPTAQQWQGQSTFEGIINYYYNQRGWRPYGMGPHLFLALEGDTPYVYVAVHPRHDGAGILDRNARWLHIEHVWDGDAAPFSPELQKASGQLLAVVCLRRGLPMKFVRGGVDNPASPLGVMYHRDQNPDWTPGAWPKSCPGLKVAHEAHDPVVLKHAAEYAATISGHVHQSDHDGRVEKGEVAVTTMGTAVRQQADWSAETRCSIPKGTQVRVAWIAGNTAWRYVEILEGEKRGWRGFAPVGNLKEY